MNKEEDTIKFLEQNIKKEPKKSLDIACGYGPLVKKLSTAYPNSRVYGLDIDCISLAKGIGKGNFERAIPILGNAYYLGKKNPDFRFIYSDGEEIKLEKFNEPLKDFDLVTTINPAFRLTSEEVNGFIMKKKLGKNREFVPIEFIAKPAKKEGRILYETEIAHYSAGLRGGISPHQVTEEIIGKALEERIKEGRKSRLEYVSHGLIKENIECEYFTVPQKITRPVSVELAVLFKKK